MYGREQKSPKMLEVQRSDSLREGEACIPPSTTHLLPPIMSEICVSAWKPTERSVSFNRDVHVKRIGRVAPRVSAALAGDGEGRLIPTPIHKESIANRTKEDLAQEAALVLHQAGNLQCVTQDNRQLPGRFSTLPVRRNKKRPELPISVRRRSEEIDGGISADLVGTPKTKKKILDANSSDVVTKGLKSSLARFFSPKLERKRKPVGRSVSDLGVSTKSHRKTTSSDNDVSHVHANREKKQLSPIIEASPQIDQQPFHFNSTANCIVGNSDNNSDKNSETDREKEEEVISRPHSQKRNRQEIKAGDELTETVATRKVAMNKSPKSSRREKSAIEHRITTEVEDRPKEQETDKKGGGHLRTENVEKRKKLRRSPSPVKNAPAPLNSDEVDNGSDINTLHTTRYDFPASNEASTIHKMISRLSNDRSPPPQLTRTMISPGPGFGHNNNKPFSYTRPATEFCSSSPPQSGSTTYAQVQSQKKKTQRSYSDSDEGLGLERKDSSRENSPAEKDYRRADYSHNSELRRNNEINISMSSHEGGDRRDAKSIHSPNHSSGTRDFVSTSFSNERRYEEFDEIIGGVHEKPDKQKLSIVVDKVIEQRNNDFHSRQVDDSNKYRAAKQNRARISQKTSDLSARRDLLESRIKSRLLGDEIFVAKNSSNVSIKNSEHEIIDKPIVPSPVIPKQTPSPKRYTDTYITETRMNSNGDKYIFEKEIHENNGKVYEYEKKVTNKIPTDGYIESTSNNGTYTVETKVNKYGDKYIIQTRTHEGYANDSKPSSGDINTEETETMESRGKDDVCKSPIADKKFIGQREFSRSDDLLDRKSRPSGGVNVYSLNTKKNLDPFHRGLSKSSQRLDEVGENSRMGGFRREYTTRSHENLSSSHVDYVNTDYIRQGTSFLDNPIVIEHKDTSPLGDKDSNRPRERTNDDYDTDVSKTAGSQLKSRYCKEIRKTHKCNANKRHPIHDEYDSSPSRIGIDCAGGYNSTRYDSDTTTKDSIHCDTNYEQSSHILREQQREQLDAEMNNLFRRSRNQLDHPDDSDARDSLPRQATFRRINPFDESPASPVKPPRTYHEGSKSRHIGQEVKTHTEQRHRKTRPNDPDRKDRLADSGIENDYKRNSQDIDRREHVESEDEEIGLRQFTKGDRNRADCNMNLTSSEQLIYNKYFDDATKSETVTAKPLSSVDKKYEKKTTKKGGTMSKVKQLFSKKEKKLKEGKSKKHVKSVSSGALTDDEVTMRYREYRGEQLRNAKSSKELGGDITQGNYSQRRRLSTPSGSPSPPSHTRLSRSMGTLTREEESFCDSNNTLTSENQYQEADKKGWFISLSRKSKANVKFVDKKPKIPDSEFQSIGTEDEEASSPLERGSPQKNLRFFGDTDQESVSSDQEHRYKRAEEYIYSKRDPTSSSGHNLNSIPSSRKPAKLTESALSSGESTTGDSSQQSQNSQRSQISVVYLHAPTVGEIPGPNERRRVASREELNRPLQSHTRTVSRSVSVLAPWKPRHYKESFEINYDQQQHQQPPASMRRKQRSRETLTRRGKETRRSKDNLIKIGTIDRSTLKLKDKRKVDRTVSTESLATTNKSRNTNTKMELNRSISVPRDASKNAGWFKLKSKKYHT